MLLSRLTTTLAFATLSTGARPAVRRLRAGRAGAHMQVGSAFPSADRWEQHLLSTPPSADKPPVPVLVLQKDEYDEWLAAQSEDQQAFLAAAGLSKFKDEGLVLLPERRWAFLTKNASSLFAFSSLPSRLPTDVTYKLESSLPLPPTAALSWGLGCYSFDACTAAGSTVRPGLRSSASGRSTAEEPPHFEPPGKGALTQKKQQDQPPRFARLLMPEACDAADTAAALSGTYLCRDLINTPAADLGPAELEAVMRDLAAGKGASVATVDGEPLRAGYPQIHAVGRAAGEARQPRLIDLTWGPADAPKVTLVGKGVCFDSGGLDIKPAAAMLTMKKDMGGAAHVLGLASMVMEAGLPVRLRVLVAAVENAISGDAFRPGDVLVARNGKTTEIGNTDAEGRLVLADALVEACSEQPELVVDCATLTGAGRVALGTDVPALFCNAPGVEIAEQLVAASATEQDQVWRLPLWPGYRAEIDSKVADLKNIGNGPYGGAITAALYLNEFVEPAPAVEGAAGGADGSAAVAPPWLHLDMMAYNTGSKPGRPEGGEAMGMRALYRLLAARYGPSAPPGAPA